MSGQRGRVATPHDLRPTGAMTTGPPTPIVLRPWTVADAADLVAIYDSADDLAHQFSHPIITPGDARRVIDSGLVCDERARNLAVVVDDHPVGNVAVTHLDPTHGTSWVSYLGSGAFRGRGLITRSVTALAGWALTPAPTGLGIFRLELGHRVDNPASGAVARAAGFIVEGLERQKLRHGDRRHDVHTYARLATDPFPDVTDVRIEGT